VKLGDLFARTVAGALGKGVAAVAREVHKEVNREVGKFIAEADALGSLPTCCDGSLVHTKDGSRMLYLHASDCAKGRP